MTLGRILVSGAGGFIGGRLVKSLCDDGQSVTAMLRPNSSRHEALPATVEIRHGDLRDAATLKQVCDGVETVFHCAGYAHVSSGSDREVEWLHREVNFVGTLHLLEAAIAQGVRRFIFLSSVKAMGRPGDQCVDENWPVPPDTAYGRAKRDAELTILSAARQYPIHVVNLRLAMVYGAGNRGNLERLTRAVRAGWFPPLPETGKRRSLVHVDDVVAAVRLAATHPAAAGQTFIVANQHVYSGRQIYDCVREASDLPPVSWHFPAALLRGAGHVGDAMQSLLRRRLPFNNDVVERLLGPECYSPARIEKVLHWHARVPLTQGLREICQPQLKEPI